MSRCVRLSSRALYLVLVAGAALGALGAASKAQIVFEPPLVSNGGAECCGMLAGDFDGDRVPDVLVCHFFLANPAAFLRGLGDGSFAPPVPLTLPLITHFHAT